MALDRDLNLSFLHAWYQHRKRPMRGWEMLAATGVRGSRWICEAPDVFRDLLFTEQNPEGFVTLQRNLPIDGKITIRTECRDARKLVDKSPFDYIDIDPFGSPLPFLPTAFDHVVTGGVLAVTATDLAVLAGAQANACRRRYQAKPLCGRLGPEGGLRILLATLERQAASQGRAIHPLLAYVLGHHLRAYVELQLRSSPNSSVDWVPSATYPGPPLPLGGPYGPLWVGPLFDTSLLSKLAVPTTAAHPEDLRRLLARFQDEGVIHVPFTYEPNSIASRQKLSHPPALTPLLEELQRRGYASGRSHVAPSAFRTRAPPSIVAEVARELAHVSSQKARVLA